MKKSQINKNQAVGRLVAPLAAVAFLSAAFADAANALALDFVAKEAAFWFLTRGL